jgi:hypothetical protein
MHALNPGIAGYHYDVICSAINNRRPQREHDMRFIALARTAVPDLLDENERLRKALKILRDRCYCYCYLPRPDDKHDPFCATEIAREALKRKP